MTFIIDYTKVATLIVNTSILFEECNNTVVNIRGRQIESKITGMWPGKSVHDWQNENIILKGLPNTS
jgi:hypothetical protein